MRVQRGNKTKASGAVQLEEEKLEDGLLKYSDADKTRFKSFFIKPKRKPGRPRKRKRKRAGRPKKKVKKTSAQLMMEPGEGEGDEIIDLTPKAAENLDARLEKAVKASRAAIKPAFTRINWDLEPHFSLRKRIADSWLLKNDLFAKGETQRKFCERMNISRPVLIRYLPKRQKELKSGMDLKPSKRGRKTHLTESVMRHICEGTLFC